MEILLRLLHKIFLPIDNLCPPSYYLLRKIVEVPNPEAYEHHVCKCGPFPYRPQKEWEAHCDEQCTKCN